MMKQIKLQLHKSALKNKKKDILNKNIKTRIYEIYIESEFTL